MALICLFRGLFRASVDFKSTFHVLLIQRMLVNKAFIGYDTSSTKIPENRRYFEVKNEISKSFVNKTIVKSEVFQSSDFQDQIFLLTMESAKMNVRYRDLLEAIRLYSNSQDENLNSSAIFLLYCCGEVLCEVRLNVRKKLTKNVWELMQKKIPKFELKHYHMLLKVCCENRERIDCQKFLSSMQIKPDESTFLLLLKGAGRCGDSSAVKFILMEMAKMGYELDGEVWESVLEVYWTRGDFISAVSTFETLISKGIKPREEMYASLACGYAKFGEIDNILKILRNHSFNGRQILDIIKHLSVSSNGKYISKVLRYLPTEEIINDLILTNYLTQLGNLGKLEDLEVIFKYLSAKENNDKVVHLVEQFSYAIGISQQPTHNILALSKTLCALHKPKKVLLKLLEASLEFGNISLSLAVMNKMNEYKIEIRNHYFWPILIEASKNGEWRIFEIIRYILSLEIQLDNTTLSEYIFPNINTKDFSIPWKKLSRCGLRNSDVRTALICFLLEEKRTTEAITILNSLNGKHNFHEVVESLVKSCDIRKNDKDFIQVLKFAPNDKDYIGIFLGGIIEKYENGSDPSIIGDYIDALKNSDFYISSVIVESLSERFHSPTRIELFPDVIKKLRNIADGRLKQFGSKSSSRFPHPNNMNLEELECHLIELKSKGLEYRGLLRKLLIAQCKKNNLKRVEELRKEFEMLNITMTPAMKAHLMYLYALWEKSDKVYPLFLDLKENHPYFLIDSYKIIHAATTIVKHGKHKEAMEMIKESKHGGVKVHIGCWRLLNEIAKSDSPELADDALAILIERKYCYISNVLLGPLIRRDILKNDWISAVKNFDFLARKYGKTPLRQELIGHLVKAKRKKLLKIVAWNVVQIHGQFTLDLEMVIAYARNEMIEELINSLKNLEKSEIPWESLTNSIPIDSKPKILMIILEASKGIRNVNRLEICELILLACCESSNCREAMKMWNIMESEGMIPTSRLREDFESLLSAHHIPLPEQHAR